MKNLILLLSLVLGIELVAQVNNTMYGLQQTTNPAGFRLATIETLAQGIYYLKIKTVDSNLTERFVKN